MELSATDPAFQSIQSLQWIYLVIFALATGEAIKGLFAPGSAEEQAKPLGVAKVYLWRLVPLIAFLVLVVPFVQGMGRFLFEVYHDPAGRTSTYGLCLLGDFVAFSVEAGLFFFLARKLQPENWRAFYLGVLAILLVDVLWAGCVIWVRDYPEILGWLSANVIGLLALLAILLMFGLPRTTRERWYGRALAPVVVVARTFLDYWWCWNLYFPAPQAA